MSSISWTSAAFYSLFSIFVFYQQLHLKSFRGASQGFGALLATSALIGTVTGFIYLGYYGWHVSWIAAVLIFVLGIVVGVTGMFIERIIGAFSLSMIGFIGWPLCAYFMFKHVPVAS